MLDNLLYGDIRVELGVRCMGHPHTWLIIILLMSVNLLYVVNREERGGGALYMINCNFVEVA